MYRGRRQPLPVSQTLPPGVFRQQAKGLCIAGIARVQAGNGHRDIVLILAMASVRAVDW